MAAAMKRLLQTVRPLPGWVHGSPGAAPQSWHGRCWRAWAAVFCASSGDMCCLRGSPGGLGDEQVRGRGHEALLFLRYMRYKVNRFTFMQVKR